MQRISFISSASLLLSPPDHPLHVRERQVDLGRRELRYERGLPHPVDVEAAERDGEEEDAGRRRRRRLAPAPPEGYGAKHEGGALTEAELKGALKNM